MSTERALLRVGLVLDTRRRYLPVMAEIGYVSRPEFDSTRNTTIIILTICRLTLIVVFVKGMSSLKLRDDGFRTRYVNAN